MRLFLLAFTISAYATSIDTLIKYYKEKNYYDVCKEGSKIFKKLQKDENLLTMYAFSCLYVDKIDRLYVPAMILGKTKESRHNRSYFSLIIAQKNILVSALVDHEEYEGLSVPNTDYVLSRVFNLYFQKKYKKIDNSYTMQDDQGKYTLFTKKENGKTWVVIEEERDGKKFLHKYR
jgi:hypothetical protein